MSINYENHKNYPNYILVRNFTGKINVQEIIKSWDYLLENQLITPQIRGVINNLMCCELEMSMDSFSILTDYLKTKDDLRRLKLAVVCDNPEIIVFPLLGELKQTVLNIKPFSTEAAAVKWIVKDL